MAVILLLAGVLAAGAMWSHSRMRHLQVHMHQRWNELARQYDRRDEIGLKLLQSIPANSPLHHAALAAMDSACTDLRCFHPSPILQSAKIADSVSSTQNQNAFASAIIAVLKITLESHQPDGPETVVGQFIQADRRASLLNAKFIVAAAAYDRAFRTFPTAEYAPLLGFTPGPFFGQIDNPASVASSGARDH